MRWPFRVQHWRQLCQMRFPQAFAALEARTALAAVCAAPVLSSGACAAATRQKLTGRPAERTSRCQPSGCSRTRAPVVLQQGLDGYGNGCWSHGKHARQQPIQGNWRTQLRHSGRSLQAEKQQVKQRQACGAPLLNVRSRLYALTSGYLGYPRRTFTLIYSEWDRP